MVGGVCGLGLILGGAWFLIRRRRGRQGKAEAELQGEGRPLALLHEMDAKPVHEAPAYGGISEMSGQGTYELPASPTAVEAGEGENKLQGTSHRT